MGKSLLERRQLEPIKIMAGNNARDRVLPRAPIRRWVLSLPFRVRYLIACDRRLCSGVRRIFLRTVLDFQRQRAEARGMIGGRSGGGQEEQCDQARLVGEEWRMR